MTETKPAGPSLDAELAEAMGWRAWLEQRGEYRLAVARAPKEKEPWLSIQNGEKLHKARYVAVSCAQAVRRGFFGQGFPEYSRKIEHAIAAAEEMRRAGRVYWWSAGAATFQEATNYTATVSGANTLHHAGGASVAHALTLALLAALR